MPGELAVCLTCLLLVSSCASSRESLCTRADTLVVQAAPPPSFLPWEVDTLAVPLNGERFASHHLVAAREPSFFASSLYLFYTAFRRTWGKFDMSRCDLHPSCSRFALEASKSLPFVIAIALTFARLVRNHNAPSVAREPRTFRKHDPVAVYTLSHSRSHLMSSITRDRDRWFHHARAISSPECTPP